MAQHSAGLHPSSAQGGDQEEDTAHRHGQGPALSDCPVQTGKLPHPRGDSSTLRHCVVRCDQCVVVSCAVCMISAHYLPIGLPDPSFLPADRHRYSLWLYIGRYVVAVPNAQCPVLYVHLLPKNRYMTRYCTLLYTSCMHTHAHAYTHSLAHGNTGVCDFLRSGDIHTLATHTKKNKLSSCHQHGHVHLA